MLKVSATNFRKHLFEYLDRAAAGETFVIQRNEVEVARLTGITTPDWREKVKIKPRLLVKPDELIRPLADIWEEYL